MKTKRIFPVILAIALVFSPAFTACDNGGGGGYTPSGEQPGGEQPGGQQPGGQQPGGQQPGGQQPGGQQPSSGGDAQLTGNITISPDTNVTINTELIANYSGSETVSYQWKKDGGNVGTNSTKYMPTASGSYTVTVSAAGYISKTSAVVDVTDPSLLTLSGNITISPSTNVTVGTELTANYSGGETVTYRWEKDGTTVGTNSTKYIPTEAGSYTVTVGAEGYNSKTSAAVTVTNVPYIITGSAPSSFTAGRGGTTIGTTGTIQNVIEAIRTDANGKDCSIQFGSGSQLSIGNASAQFNNSGGIWGVITLSGAISSTAQTAGQGTITTGDTVSIVVRSGAIAGFPAIYHNSTGTLTISGGTVTGGSQPAIILSNNTGLITVSGGTVTTSSTDSTGGAIVINSPGTVPNITIRLEISGGTVQNTSTVENTNALFFLGTNTVIISGGTVSAKGNAFRGATPLYLRGNPEITGVIYNANSTGTGSVVTVTGSPTFAPSPDRVYTLDRLLFTVSSTAVVGGAPFLSNFALANPSYKLEASGNNNLVIADNP
jgi:hypothetical protein